MSKFIAPLFASNPVAEEPVSKCEEWLILKLAVEKLGNQERLAEIRAAAQQGYGRIIEMHGNGSVLYLTHEGLETYCGLCLDAFNAIWRAMLRLEVCEPIAAPSRVAASDSPFAR
ncbi:hypothetical protein B0G69_6510 [Paraburkholderia sp. RAU2J]|uniref:hypothetical protein n=1 Tax=Paraburkholderia sp. RAU2J TaxID=1938810 RepID=UPI000EAB7BFF|nr:hypothetical protein [Paraburkholderia sp. RAU2J]RKT13369.1 hypothetical protein B0G69_6510 [Paraburkholderia sp. RAU2J]